MPGYPGIYAEVSTVLDWIEQYVPQPQRKKWMKKYVTKSKQFVLFYLIHSHSMRKWLPTK